LIGSVTADYAFGHAPPPEEADTFTLADITEENTLPASGEGNDGHFEDGVERGRFYRRQLRASFLRFFVAMLQKYRKCIDVQQIKSHGVISGDTAFNTKAFLEDFPKADQVRSFRSFVCVHFRSFSYIYIYFFYHCILFSWVYCCFCSQPFMVEMLSTQMWSVFLYERLDYHRARVSNYTHQVQRSHDINQHRLIFPVK
jgi:hypothetical protein